MEGRHSDGISQLSAKCVPILNSPLSSPDRFKTREQLSHILRLNQHNNSNEIETDMSKIFSIKIKVDTNRIESKSLAERARSLLSRPPPSALNIDQSNQKHYENLNWEIRRYWDPN
jgi:hypothetical protein